MSARIIRKAWDTPLPINQKIVLAALADKSGTDGICSISINSLSWRCSTDVNEIIGIIKELSDKGYINIHGHPGCEPYYQMLHTEWETPNLNNGDDQRHERPNKTKWRSLRAKVLSRDNHVCQYCGHSGIEMYCDHVIPLSVGGTNDLDNLVTSCWSCNQKKANKTPEEWLGKNLAAAVTSRFVTHRHTQSQGGE